MPEAAEFGLLGDVLLTLLQMPDTFGSGYVEHGGIMETLHVFTMETNRTNLDRQVLSLTVDSAKGCIVIDTERLDSDVQEDDSIFRVFP